MVPQNKSTMDDERTEELPAQEKVASGFEPAPALSAEQAYAQRFAETSPNGHIPDQGYIP